MTFIALHLFDSKDQFSLIDDWSVDPLWIGAYEIELILPAIIW